MPTDLTKARQLFGTFSKIGAFTFGGGYAMISLIQREVTERRRWLEDRAILDIVAIAESTPGPIAINTAFVLRQFSDLAVVQYAFNGIRAGVLALLLKALLSMYRQSPKGAVSYAVMAGAFVLTAFCGMDAVLVILASATVGLLSARMAKRRAV